MIKGFCFYIFIGKMIVNLKLNKYFCISDVVNTAFKNKKAQSSSLENPRP